MFLYIHKYRPVNFTTYIYVCMSMHINRPEQNVLGAPPHRAPLDPLSYIHTMYHIPRWSYLDTKLHHIMCQYDETFWTILSSFSPYPCIGYVFWFKFLMLIVCSSFVMMAYKILRVECQNLSYCIPSLAFLHDLQWMLPSPL